MPSPPEATYSETQRQASSPRRRRWAAALPWIVALAFLAGGPACASAQGDNSGFPRAAMGGPFLAYGRSENGEATLRTVGLWGTVKGLGVTYEFSHLEHKTLGQLWTAGLTVGVAVPVWRIFPWVGAGLHTGYGGDAGPGNHGGTIGEASFSADLVLVPFAHVFLFAGRSYHYVTTGREDDFGTYRVGLIVAL